MRQAFETTAQVLIDRWIASEGEMNAPEAVFAPIATRLKANMILGVVDLQADDPLDFAMRFIHKYRVPTKLWRNERIQSDQLLREFGDRDYMTTAVIPTYLTLIENRRPMMDLVHTRIFGVTVHYDRLLLPQKTEARPPAWCITFTRTRMLLAGRAAGPEDVSDDPVCEAVLQLLIEGSSAKEIGQILGLSPRTVEHRLGKLKAAYDARNVAHLVALAISSKLNRGGSRHPLPDDLKAAV